MLGAPHVPRRGYGACTECSRNCQEGVSVDGALIVMEDGNGQPLSLGSGFFVRDGEIASNLHVVEGAARGYAKLVAIQK